MPDEYLLYNIPLLNWYLAFEISVTSLLIKRNSLILKSNWSEKPLLIKIIAIFFKSSEIYYRKLNSNYTVKDSAWMEYREVYHAYQTEFVFNR